MSNKKAARFTTIPRDFLCERLLTDFWRLRCARGLSYLGKSRAHCCAAIALESRHGTARSWRGGQRASRDHLIFRRVAGRDFFVRRAHVDVEGCFTRRCFFVRCPTRFDAPRLRVLREAYASNQNQECQVHRRRHNLRGSRNRRAASAAMDSRMVRFACRRHRKYANASASDARTTIASAILIREPPSLRSGDRCARRRRIFAIAIRGTYFGTHRTAVDL